MGGEAQVTSRLGKWSPDRGTFRCWLEISSDTQFHNRAYCLIGAELADLEIISSSRYIARVDETKEDKVKLSFFTDIMNAKNPNP